MMLKQRTVLFVIVALLVLAAAGAAVVWKLPSRNAHGTVEYGMLAPHDIPTTVAAAPDGGVWFTIDFGEGVGRVRDGKVQRVPKPGGRNVEPIGLAVDSNGAAWVTDPSKIAITRIAADGTTESFPLGTPVARLARLAVAPDGAVWFAESTAFSITRLKDGQLKRHEFKSLRGGPYGVAVGPDGTVWGTLQSGNQLLRIAPSGEMSEYDLPTPSAAPTDVAVDKQGGVWVVEFSANKIAHFVDGKFTEYPLPQDKAAPSGITVAPDGSVWFGVLRGASLGRLQSGQMTFSALPRDNARPYSVTADASGNVWYADITGYVGMVAAR
jgi:virginiamycin B lyase